MPLSKRTGNIPLQCRVNGIGYDHFTSHKNRKKLRVKYSRDLAYIYGVLIGDGNITPVVNKLRGHHTHLIQLVCKEERFCRSFLDAANRVLGTNYDNAKKRKDGYWKSYVVSNALAEWTTTVDAEKLVKKHPADFLRGYYESEGGSHGGQISFGSLNEDDIFMAMFAMNELGFYPRLYTQKVTSEWANSSTLYRLRLYRKSEVERFLATIRPCIKDLGIEVREKSNLDRLKGAL